MSNRLRSRFDGRLKRWLGWVLGSWAVLLVASLLAVRVSVSLRPTPPPPFSMPHRSPVAGTVSPAKSPPIDTLVRTRK